MRPILLLSLVTFVLGACEDNGAISTRFGKEFGTYYVYWNVSKQKPIVKIEIADPAIGYLESEHNSVSSDSNTIYYRSTIRHSNPCKIEILHLWLYYEDQIDLYYLNVDNLKKDIGCGSTQ